MGSEASPKENRDPRDVYIELAATKLFVAVWRAMQAGHIDAREPIADAALTLRDNLNPNWPSDADWLPEPLASERAADSAQESALES